MRLIILYISFLYQQILSHYINIYNIIYTFVVFYLSFKINYMFAAKLYIFMLDVVCICFTHSFIASNLASYLNPKITANSSHSVKNLKYQFLLLLYH